MPHLETPWRRPPKADLGLLPDAPTAAWIHRQPEHTLARILRDNLICRNDYPVKQWRRFWDLIGLDEDLTDRVADILEEFKQQADSPDTTTMPAAELKRHAKFARNVDDRLHHLERAEHAPLSWAGPKAERYNKPARAVIDELVTAIDDHRQGGTDEALYDTLTRLSLDPNDPST